MDWLTGCISDSTAWECFGRWFWQTVIAFGDTFFDKCHLAQVASTSALNQWYFGSQTKAVDVTASCLVVQGVQDKLELFEVVDVVLGTRKQVSRDDDMVTNKSNGVLLHNTVVVGLNVSLWIVFENTFFCCLFAISKMNSLDCNFYEKIKRNFYGCFWLANMTLLEKKLAIQIAQLYCVQIDLELVNSFS